MRIILVGLAAVSLSGCTFLKNMGLHTSSHTSYDQFGTASTDCCGESQRLSRWNLEGAVGPNFIVGGDLTTPDQAHNIPGVTTNEISLRDAFDPGTRVELGGSYAINPNRKVIVSGAYTFNEGDVVNYGSIDGNQVSGRVSDLETYGVEAGVRQYFGIKPAPVINSYRPYVEGRLGATYVDDVALENVAINGQPIGGDAGLYEGSWVPTAAGMVGVETPIFKQTTLALETGIRYTGARKTDTSVLSGGVPFAGSNNADGSWTVPVMLRGRYRF